MKIVWPDTFVEEGALARNISALRKALGDDAESSQYVETIPKRGYRFIATVKDLSVAAPPEAIVPPKKKHASFRWVAWLVAGALLILAAVVAFPSLNRRFGARPPNISSLAVLPLNNLSNDPAQEYFADGMTEELINSLAKIEALRVISRTSAMTYKGVRNKSLPQIL